jgi:hypothetical protein
VYCNLTMRRDKSFADDLIVHRGVVSSRVALLLRSAETKPLMPRFVPFRNHPSQSNRRPLSVRPSGEDRDDEGRVMGSHRLWPTREGRLRAVAGQGSRRRLTWTDVWLLALAPRQPAAPSRPRVGVSALPRSVTATR